jgi:phosphomevalonate kinase
VAAAVLGGTIAFTRDERPTPLTLRGVSLAFVWSGRPASTVGLLDRVDALARRAPAEHRALLAELTAVAAELAAAYRDADATAIVGGTAAYGAALARLGRAASAPIVTSAHQRIAELARRAGGAAKPSGAGGGDMAVAVFGEPAARAAFLERCREHGLAPFELAPEAPGLAAEAGL